jgi:hypothetical protein
VTGNEDLQIYLDLAALYDFVVVPRFLTAYRLLPSSKSHDVWNMRAGHRSVLTMAQREHPSLPAWLFRWSEAHQLWFLGFRCLHAGRKGEGVRLLLATIRRDPSFILRLTMRPAFVRAIFSRLHSTAVREQRPRRRFLDGGPPPELEVPRVNSWIEKRRSRRISSVSVRTAAAGASGQATTSRI